MSLNHSQLCQCIISNISYLGKRKNSPYYLVDQGFYVWVSVAKQWKTKVGQKAFNNDST